MNYKDIKFSGITGAGLKILAIVTMVIDHVGAVLFPEQLIFRYIGRLSFPIFRFLLVEGFVHTRNVYRYVLRLGIFAIISEIPYDLAFSNELFNWDKQNVFFTLCLGVATLYLLKYTKRNWEKAIYIVFAIFFAEMLKSDYGAFGLLLIIWFYMLYDDKAWKLAGGAIWSFYNGIGIQSYGALAMIPIAFYNGKKGKQIKYFFYLFYPLHLLLLYQCDKYLF